MARRWIPVVSRLRSPRAWIRFILLAVLAGISQAAFGQSQQTPETATRVFRAGAAASNITPPLGELIVGGWQPYPARHIHDELHARCLVLDDGTTRLALVLSDSVGIPRGVYDAAKDLVHEELGLPKSHLLFAATHTHSATSAFAPVRDLIVQPEQFGEYQRFLIRRIADGVHRAVHNLEPARIGWGKTDAPSHVFNRRWFLAPGAEDDLRNPFGGVDRVRMNPGRGKANLLRPAGPTDPEIVFLSVQSTDGRPIAVLANYSLHYVGGTGNAEVSADYFAVFADRLQQLLVADRLDPPFVGIMSNGTSGDVNNINFRAKGQRLAPYQQMRAVGRHVAQRVYEAYRHVQHRDWVQLGAVERELALRVRKPTADQLQYLKTVQAAPDDAPMYHRRSRIYASRVMRQAEAPAEVSVQIQAMRIGELGVAAIPFEVFAEIGLEIKQKCPLEQAFTISIANGYFGYLPTPRQHALGGYETWLGTNTVEVQASEKIVDSLLEMFGEL